VAVVVVWSIHPSILAAAAAILSSRQSIEANTKLNLRMPPKKRRGRPPSKSSKSISAAKASKACPETATGTSSSSNVATTGKRRKRRNPTELLLQQSSSADTKKRRHKQGKHKNANNDDDDDDLHILNDKGMDMETDMEMDTEWKTNIMHAIPHHTSFIPVLQTPNPLITVTDHNSNDITKVNSIDIHKHTPSDVITNGDYNLYHPRNLGALSIPKVNPHSNHNHNHNISSTSNTASHSTHSNTRTPHSAGCRLSSLTCPSWTTIPQATIYYNPEVEVEVQHNENANNKTNNNHIDTEVEEVLKCVTVMHVNSNYIVMGDTSGHVTIYSTIPLIVPITTLQTTMGSRYIQYQNYLNLCKIQRKEKKIKKLSITDGSIDTSYAHVGHVGHGHGGRKRKSKNVKQKNKNNVLLSSIDRQYAIEAIALHTPSSPASTSATATATPDEEEHASGTASASGGGGVVIGTKHEIEYINFFNQIVWTLTTMDIPGSDYIEEKHDLIRGSPTRLDVSDVNCGFGGGGMSDGFDDGFGGNGNGGGILASFELHPNHCKKQNDEHDSEDENNNDNNNDNHIENDDTPNNENNDEKGDDQKDEKNEHDSHEINDNEKKKDDTNNDSHKSSSSSLQTNENESTTATGGNGKDNKEELLSSAIWHIDIHTGKATNVIPKEYVNQKWRNVTVGHCAMAIWDKSIPDANNILAVYTTLKHPEELTNEQQRQQGDDQNQNEPSSSSSSSSSIQQELFLLNSSYQVIFRTTLPTKFSGPKIITCEAINQSPKGTFTIAATSAKGGIRLFKTEGLVHLGTFGEGVSLHGHSIFWQDCFFIEMDTALGGARAADDWSSIHTTTVGATKESREKLNGTTAAANGTAASKYKSQNNNKDDDSDNKSSRQEQWGPIIERPDELRHRGRYKQNQVERIKVGEEESLKCLFIVSVPHADREPVDMQETIHFWDVSFCEFYGGGNKLPSFTLQAPKRSEGIVSLLHDTSYVTSQASRFLLSTHSGECVQLIPTMTSDWAGQMYPAGYQVLDNNIIYIEDEDELDNVVLDGQYDETNGYCKLTQQQQQHSVGVLDDVVSSSLRHRQADKELEKAIRISAMDEPVDVINDEYDVTVYETDILHGMMMSNDDKANKAPRFVAPCRPQPQLKSKKYITQKSGDKGSKSLQTLNDDDDDNGDDQNDGKAAIDLLTFFPQIDHIQTTLDAEKVKRQKRNNIIDSVKAKAAADVSNEEKVAKPRSRVAIVEAMINSSVDKRLYTSMLEKENYSNTTSGSAPQLKLGKEGKSDQDKARRNSLCAACRGRKVIHACGKRVMPIDYESIEKARKDQKEKERRIKLDAQAKKRREAELKRKEAKKKKKEEEEIRLKQEEEEKQLAEQSRIDEGAKSNVSIDATENNHSEDDDAATSSLHGDRNEQKGHESCYQHDGAHEISNQLYHSESKSGQEEYGRSGTNNICHHLQYDSVTKSHREHDSQVTESETRFHQDYHVESQSKSFINHQDYLSKSQNEYAHHQADHSNFQGENRFHHNYPGNSQGKNRHYQNYNAESQSENRLIQNNQGNFQSRQEQFYHGSQSHTAGSESYQDYKRGGYDHHNTYQKGQQHGHHEALAPQNGNGNHHGNHERSNNDDMHHYEDHHYSYGKQHTNSNSYDSTDYYEMRHHSLHQQPHSSNPTSSHHVGHSNNHSSVAPHPYASQYASNNNSNIHLTSDNRRHH